MNTTVLRRAPLVIVVILGCPPALFGESVPSLETIRELFVQRDAVLVSLLVEAEVTAQLHVSQAEAEAIAGTRKFHSRKVVAAFKGPKRFYQNHIQRPGQPIANTSGMTYDGENTRIQMFGKVGRIWPGDKTEQFAAPDNFMAYHGSPKGWFRVFVSDKKWVPLQLPGVFDDMQYEVSQELTPAQDGTKCVLVQSAEERLWLDPALGFALRQREWSSPSGQTATQIRFSDHLEVHPGVWLARSIARDFFADKGAHPKLAGKPYLTEIVRASRVTTDVPDNLFHLNFSAGVVVNDLTRIPREADGIPGVVYRIPQDPTQLDAIAAEATQLRLAAENADRKSGLANVLLFLAVNGLLVLAALVVWRRRRLRTVHEG